MNKPRIGIVIFDEVEALDFCGPFEVFSITTRQDSLAASSVTAFEVLLVAATDEPVTTIGGMQVLPSVTLADCPPLDVLIVPGGWGTREQLRNPELINWIKERAAEVQLLASVCTGALILGVAGLLDGRRATTHWQCLTELRRLCPQAAVVTDEHVVDDGNLLTSAGISAGIDLALHIVGRYVGEPTARRTAREMEYPYPENNRRRVVIET